MRESPGLERFAPLISTQVFAAMTGFSPSAFATRVIVGVWAHTAGRTASIRAIRTDVIPSILLQGNHDTRGRLRATNGSLKSDITRAETRGNGQVHLIKSRARDAREGGRHANIVDLERHRVGCFRGTIERLARGNRRIGGSEAGTVEFDNVPGFGGDGFIS